MARREAVTQAGSRRRDEPDAPGLGVVHVLARPVGGWPEAFGRAQERPRREPVVGRRQQPAARRGGSAGRRCRFVLGLVVTVYATIVTAQSVWGWYVWLAGQDRYVGMLRRYLLVHGLRLRLRAFWGDAVICALLCVVFVSLWRAHVVVRETGEALQQARQLNPDSA